MQMSSKFSNFSSSNSSMATLEKKSPINTTRLPHQQSLPTPKHHHPLQAQLSAPLQTKHPVTTTAESMQVSIEQSEKSSLNSIELDCDCDRGFGSMSSSDQAQVRRQNSQKEIEAQQQQAQLHQQQQQKEVDELKQEVSKLKCDKLDLLRQNVVSL
jgi:hypothetical protein